MGKSDEQGAGSGGRLARSTFAFCRRRSFDILLDWRRPTVVLGSPSSIVRAVRVAQAGERAGHPSRWGFAAVSRKFPAVAVAAELESHRAPFS